MTIRKITVCILLFSVLLIGAAIVNRQIKQTHYRETRISPYSHNVNINHELLSETTQRSQIFNPREYIRIKYGSTNE